MALIPCADCGKQISTEAPFCPNCNRPNAPVAAAAPPIPNNMQACADCGNLMSKSAAACPRCGWRLPAKPKLTKDLGAGSWLFFLGLLGVVLTPFRAIGGLFILIGIVLMIVRLAQRD